MEISQKTNFINGLPLDNETFDLEQGTLDGLQAAIKNLKDKDQLSLSLEGSFNLLRKIGFSGLAGILVERDLSKYKMTFYGKVLGSVAGDGWQKGSALSFLANANLTQGLDAEVELSLNSPEEAEKILESILKLPDAEQQEFILSRLSAINFGGQISGNFSTNLATLLEKVGIDSEFAEDFSKTWGAGMRQGIRVEFENKKPVAVVQESQIRGSLGQYDEAESFIEKTGSLSVAHKHSLPNVFKSHEQILEFVVDTHDSQKKSGKESLVRLYTDAIEEIYQSGFFSKLLQGDYEDAFQKLDANGISYDREERSYEQKGNYSLRTFLNSSVSNGTIVNKSPTMP